MNRTTAVVMALAILVAHTLAIYQTPEGAFAPPYDRAHVAYRLGRHLVHEGSAIWNPSESWTDAYPSVVWILVSAVAEWFNLYPTLVAQFVGIFCTLIAAVILAQFSANRMAGLIAPVLFATSGTVAATAASGTEMSLAMMLATLSFLAFERGWGRLLVLSSSLLVFTRPEGVGLVVTLALFELIDRPRSIENRRSMKRALSTVFLVLAIGLVARGVLLGSWVSSFTTHLLAADGERFQLGLHYFGGFFIASASAPLILLPTLFMFFGRLAGTGRRALLVFVVWTLTVMVSGGDSLPFWNALSPTVPLAFIAIQSAITNWIDRNPHHSPIACAVVAATVLMSLVASKLPGDLGPIRLRGFIERWTKPDEITARAFPRQLARSGLLSELREVGTLRVLGIFLRDEVNADARVASFWPGAIGYLSRKKTIDVLGRTSPPSGAGSTLAWEGVPRVDLIEMLAQPIDYFIPTLGSSDTGVFPNLFHVWLDRYDIEGDSPERMRELISTLRRYELVSVPVATTSADPDIVSEHPFIVLRNRDLGTTPIVELSVAGDEFQVDVRHEGHRQVVDLAVTWLDGEGVRRSLRPTGDWTTAIVDARTRLLMYETGGERPIRVLTGMLPDGANVGTLTARLHSPGLPFESLFGTAGTPDSVELPR